MVTDILLVVAEMLGLLGIFIAVLIGLGAIAFLWVRVPFAPTPQAHVDRVMDVLLVGKNKIFYDLGCGDGRFIFAAARRGANATGFEVAPWPFLKTAVRRLISGSNAKVKFSNFYYRDLHDADAIFCFLIYSVMPRVEEKLRRELKTGARVACYGFKLPTWKPDQIIDFYPERKKSSKLFVYTVHT